MSSRSGSGHAPPTTTTAPPASPINPPTPTPCCLGSTTHSILSHRVPASLRHASHPKSAVTRRRASPLVPRPLPPPPSSKNPCSRHPVGLLDILSIVLRGRGRGVTVIKADALSRWGRGRGSPATRQLKDSDGGGFLLLLLLTFGMLNAAVKTFKRTRERRTFWWLSVPFNYFLCTSEIPAA